VRRSCSVLRRSTEQRLYTAAAMLSFAAEEWMVIARTLMTALVAVALITPPGLALSWLLARRAWRGKALVEALVTLPLVVPPVATGFILLTLLGRRGTLGSLLDRIGFEVVFTPAAIVIAAAVMAFPLFVRSARAAFEGVSARLEDVARTLGSSEREVFWRVTLPLSGRGIIAAALLAFARALGEFGATILLAGNIPGRTSTIALSIYQAFELGDNATAGRFVFVSFVIALVALLAADAVSRKRGLR